MTDENCLGQRYSTTRLLTCEQTIIENKREDKFETVLFLPKGEGRQGEGGLRTQGHFKQGVVDKPVITVITVVFNGEHFLEETIQSIINQSYDNVEYIIIDGGSSDSTLDIIRKYEHAIDYWVSEKDSGIYDAMNKGIFLASNGWVNFMNSGDVFFKSDVIEIISNNCSSEVIYGNHSTYSDNINHYQTVKAHYWGGNRNIPYCHQAVFIKTELLKNTPFDIKYDIAADFDQYLKIKEMQPTVKHVNLTVVKYLAGGLSSVARKKLIREYYEISKIKAPCSALIFYLKRRLVFYFIGG